MGLAFRTSETRPASDNALMYEPVWPSARGFHAAAGALELLPVRRSASPPRGVRRVSSDGRGAELEGPDVGCRRESDICAGAESGRRDFYHFVHVRLDEPFDWVIDDARDDNADADVCL